MPKHCAKYHIVFLLYLQARDERNNSGHLHSLIITLMQAETQCDTYKTQWHRFCDIGTSSVALTQTRCIFTNHNRVWHRLSDTDTDSVTPAMTDCDTDSVTLTQIWWRSHRPSDTDSHSDTDTNSVTLIQTHRHCHQLRGTDTNSVALSHRLSNSDTSFVTLTQARWH